VSLAKLYEEKYIALSKPNHKNPHHQTTIYNYIAPFNSNKPENTQKNKSQQSHSWDKL
jgi:hypothetical protein